MGMIINEEKISFSSRFNELIDEYNNSNDPQYRLTNESLAEQLHTTFQTISSWRNGKFPSKANKTLSCDKIYSELGDIFDVDPGYLKCTQIERKEEVRKRKKRTQHKSSGKLDRWKNKISPEEEERLRRELQEAKEKSNIIQRAIQLCSSFDIVIEHKIIGSHEMTHTYQILEDNTIYTIQEIIDNPEVSEKYTIVLPDKSERTISEDQIIDLYNVMKDFCISQLNK